MAVPIVALIMVFGGLVAIFWVIFSTIRRLKVARLQSEVHSRLIEKMGSSQELLTFLGSDAGKELVASIGIEQPSREPYGRILSSVQAGVILLLVGIALLILGGQFANAAEGFFILGGLAVALGAGFLVSAGLSYRLSKAFGLFERERTVGKLAA
ncbi:MAG: hypothetical protein P8Z30_11035 [Acidobacteriota bacterium]